MCIEEQATRGRKPVACHVGAYEQDQELCRLLPCRWPRRRSSAWMRKAPWQPLEVWWAWADVLGQLVVGELRADRVLARWA